MPTAPPCAIVIFGASGDLAKRKLIPAIYEMARENLLNDSTYVVGYSRSPMTDEQYRKEMRAAVEKHARSQPIDEAVWKSLEPRLYYTQADYGSSDDHARVDAGDHGDRVGDAVAARLVAAKRAGGRVVGVVSAMGQHTDELVALAQATAPQLTSAVSRKTHGSNDFDIALPLAGPSAIECRPLRA